MTCSLIFLHDFRIIREELMIIVNEILINVTYTYISLKTDINMEFLKRFIRQEPNIYFRL